MNKYEQFTILVKQISKIYNDEKFGTKIFELLKDVIDFKSGYIFFLNPERLEYSLNPEVNNIDDISESYLKENLIFKNSIFGQIIITGGQFTREDKEIFLSFASIISNSIKDIELTKVIKMQIDALQQGYFEADKKTKKIKKSDEIKTKFLSHITHELRTPLNSILGFSELLENEFAGKLNNKQKEYVNDIKISGINLLGMINEILDMSKIEAGAMNLNKTKFSVQAAIEEAVNIILPLLMKKNIKFEQTIDDIEIIADYQKFQQILLNLLGNAVKFTQPGGNIGIISVKEGKNLILKVKDNGSGIEKNLQKKIFRRFEQGNKPAANSTGLGLAITKEFVKMHKGKIKVNSRSNKGSQFIVTIPAEQIYIDFNWKYGILK